MKKRSSHRPSFKRAAQWCQQLESRLLFTTLPSGFAETQVASGITSPIAMAIAIGLVIPLATCVSAKPEGKVVNNRRDSSCWHHWAARLKDGRWLLRFFMIILPDHS